MLYAASKPPMCGAPLWEHTTRGNDNSTPIAKNFFPLIFSMNKLQSSENCTLLRQQTFLKYLKRSFPTINVEWRNPFKPRRSYPGNIVRHPMDRERGHNYNATAIKCSRETVTLKKPLNGGFLESDSFSQICTLCEEKINW